MNTPRTTEEIAYVVACKLLKIPVNSSRGAGKVIARNYAKDIKEALDTERTARMEAEREVERLKNMSVTELGAEFPNLLELLTQRENEIKKLVLAIGFFLEQLKELPDNMAVRYREIKDLYKHYQDFAGGYRCA